MKSIDAGLLAIAIAGCAHQSGGEIVLVPDVQRGPANAAPPGRVLALRASCGSVEYRCPQEFGQTVDSIVRGGLEFAGYTVVDDESLRSQTRQRHEEHVVTRSDDTSRSRSDTHVDLIPLGQHATTEGSRRGRSEK